MKSITEQNLPYSIVVRLIPACLLAFFSPFALAATDSGHRMDMTFAPVGYAALAVFVLAYIDSPICGNPNPLFLPPALSGP
jgi:hypothetical protein